MCVVSIVRFERSNADSGYTTSNQTTVPCVQTRSILSVFFLFSGFLKAVEIFRWNVSVLFLVGVSEFTVGNVDKASYRKPNALAVVDEKGRYWFYPTYWDLNLFEIIPKQSEI